MSYVVEIKPSSIYRRIISFIIDYIILLPFVIILYQLWKDNLWNGQSIGNKIVKIQLIDFKTGKKPSFNKVVIKNVLFILSLGLGSFIMFFNDGRRGLGDLICSTFLIKSVNVKLF